MKFSNLKFFKKGGTPKFDFKKNKVFTRGYAALPDYGIETCYCESADLVKWSLDPKQLITEPTALTPSEADELIRDYDKVLNL